MAFFTLSNPMALFFALIVVLTLIKFGLGKIKYLAEHEMYVVPLVILCAIICIAFFPLLKLAALAIPMIVLILLFLFLIAGLFFALGMKEGEIFGFMKQSGLLKTVVFVLVVVAIVFAGSQIWGKQLLKDKSVSLADAITPEEKQKEIDFSPIFTKQVAGFAMLIIVIGMVFWWVNSR